MLFFLTFFCFSQKTLNENQPPNLASNETIEIDKTNENFIDQNSCGSNTFQTKDGKCHCKEGYSHGDPNQPSGCFKCPPKCHPNATCKSPGQCICMEGMIGDGINKCEPPIPEILQIKPSFLHGKGNDKVLISFQLSTNYYQKNGFCRFDSTVIEGNISMNSELICLSPVITEKVTKIFISFDNRSWSKNEKILAVEQPLPMKKLIFNIFSCFFIFSGIPSCLKSHFCKGKKNTAEYDIIQNPEEQPFKDDGKQKQGEQLFGEFA